MKSMLKLYENPNMIVNAEDLSNTHKNVLILLKTQHKNAQNHFLRKRKYFTNQNMTQGK